MYPFILYGANGYTADLIIELALQHNVKPLLAGRNAERMKEVATRYGLEYEVCSVDDAAALDKLVKKSGIFLNCAGPFIYTAETVARACMANKSHYLDITGEYDVFEKMHSLDSQAKAAGIMLLSGTGFDVVPSDCLSLHLKNRLPSANYLEMAFNAMAGGMSRGTAKTTVEGMGQGGKIRKDGKLVTVPMVYMTKVVDFGPYKSPTVSIPWGDICTAYYSTGIPNIVALTAVKQSMINTMKWNDRIGFLLRTKWLKNFLIKQIDKRPPGPNEKRRQTTQAHFRGTVTDAAGNSKVTLLTTPHAYTLTAMTAFGIVQEILAGNLKTGYQTPATAYGADFILKFEGVTRTDI
jgi:short subunit dehydrogenase-like uncharacterized protein